MGRCPMTSADFLPLSPGPAGTISVARSLFLKAENEILRSRIKGCVRPTRAERDRLLKLGKPFLRRRRRFYYLIPVNGALAFQISVRPSELEPEL